MHNTFGDFFMSSEQTSKTTEICNLYKDGKSIKEIAEVYENTVSYIAQILRKNGFELARGPKKGMLHNPELIDNICLLAKEGKTTKEIAEHFQRTPQNINKILSKQGIKSVRGPNPKKGVSTKPEQMTKICELASNGKTRSEIAELVGISAGRVSSILSEKGIELEKVKWNSNPEKIELVCNMFKEGKSVKEIAEHFGNTTARISRILNPRGFRSRNPNQNRPDGKFLDKEGYLWIRMEDDDPLISMRTKRKIVLDHRLVVARHYNRPLDKDETVHHINGNKQDNRFENLQLRQGKHGKGTVRQCFDCKSFDIETNEFDQCRTCKSTKIKSVEI